MFFFSPELQSSVVGFFRIFVVRANKDVHKSFLVAGSAAVLPVHRTARRGVLRPARLAVELRRQFRDHVSVRTPRALRAAVAKEKSMVRALRLPVVQLFCRSKNRCAVVGGADGIC